MRRKLTTIAVFAVLVATASTLAATAAAGPLAKQRVQLQLTEAGSFVLAPMSSGALQRDTGIASSCCWSRQSITRDGIANEIDDPQVTLRGKRGTLVLRNRIEFFDIPGGDAVFTGTWKVVRGTGAYAGIAGGGHGGGLQRASGDAKAMFDGFLK